MPTHDRSFWEERWSQALREHPDRVADRPPNAHLSAEVANLRPGLALDTGVDAVICARRRFLTSQGCKDLKPC